MSEQEPQGHGSDMPNGVELAASSHDASPQRLDDDETLSNVDQTVADADQIAADSDQTASDRNQDQADTDQRTSNRDQAVADHENAARAAAGESDSVYESTRAERLKSTLGRTATGRARAQTATERSRQPEPMRRPVRSLLLLIPLSILLAACGATSSGRITAARATTLARWTASASVSRVLDLSGPRRDGTVIVATAGRLATLRPGATSAEPFASGAGGYASPGGEEPYVALSAAAPPHTAGCSFGTDTLYALRLTHGAGVTVVSKAGIAHRFARLGAPGLASGIAFDDTGRFGHRLLVTVTAGSKTTVNAVDCHGTVTTITRDAPQVEGGIVVAPASFGRFAGDLIAPDEHSGRIYATGPDGRTQLVADSGLPHGADVGVESAGFVPAGFGAGGTALVADRLTPGNPHPGDDVVLSLGAAALNAAGVGPGDLLIAGEGGAQTDSVTCRRTCRVRYVAGGPSIAHAEGHIVFTTG